VLKIKHFFYFFTLFFEALSIVSKQGNTILYIVISAAHYRHCSENVACVMRPPVLSFRLAEKKERAAPGIAGCRCLRQRKAARNLRSRAFGGPS
jgi:hypothetical protein